jgi:RNA polymerase sigma factor (sigma-70 family)
MILCSPPAGDVVKRLLPSSNPDREDRAYAWNQWIGSGGAEPVRKFIRWSNGTDMDDDEILQDALITAYIKVERGEYQPRDVPFTAYVKKIARYKILEASRRNAGQLPLDDAVEIPEDHNPTENVDFWREYEVLHSALAELPPRRSKVNMLYENGYSTAEIAAQLAIKEELVRKEKSLGMRQLKDKMALAIAT